MDAMWSTRMRVVVLGIVGLYVAAHFLPAYSRENPWHDPVDGWEISSRIVHPLLTRPMFSLFGAPGVPISYGQYLLWLPNPLFCLGAVAILIGRPQHRRLTGMLAAAAGSGALICLAACVMMVYRANFFGSSFRLVPLLGSYLWITSMVLLVLAGLCQALVRIPGP
jgi:CHASE2 domain-containing sensor protein